MVFFFSGDTSKVDYPEEVLEAEQCLGVMLTYYDVFERKGVRDRYKELERRQLSEKRKAS